MLGFRAIAADLHAIELPGDLAAVPEGEAFPADKLIGCLVDNLDHELLEHDRPGKLADLRKVRFLQVFLPVPGTGSIQLPDGFQVAFGNFGHLRAGLVVILGPGLSSGQIWVVSRV